MTDEKPARIGAHNDSQDATGQYASPPCYQHELDPAFQTNASDAVVSAENWISVNAWRKQQRSRLIAARDLLSDAERAVIAAAVRDTLGKEFPIDNSEVGFYWPLAGEIDLRPLVVDLLQAGCMAALPVIVGKGEQLEFWRWSPQQELNTDGIWGIPAPFERNPISPSILLLPLLGFDSAGHRLGHGGGYYDRTLAAMDPKPVTVGVGYEIGRLGTIYPQQHDVPLNAVVTEQGLHWYSAQRSRSQEPAR